MRIRQSEYMNWAKTQSRAKYNLATSGVAGFPLSDLSPLPLDINGPDGYGYAPLSAAIAQHHGIDPACVVTAAGTSFANFLALSAVLEPGDEVLLEQPGYELILSAALYLGADVKRFQRLEENAFAVDPAEVRRQLTPKTKLIVLTNLHNPTSVLTPEPVLREVGDLARSVGARVLVDEVYLDVVYTSTPRTSFHLGPEFIVTSSLTKVYGLSGLRCGWILAQPDLARVIWRLNDLFASNNAHPAELLSVMAFRNLDAIRQKARSTVDTDRAALRQFLLTQTRFVAIPSEWGTTSALRLKDGSVDDFLARLRTAHETSAVPGRFFEMPNYIRIGMGTDSQMFGEGLRRLLLP